MTFNMPQMFEMEQLRGLWDTAMLTLKKSFELAMQMSSAPLHLKQTMLTFGLTM
jgi:hypothetical protein